MIEITSREEFPALLNDLGLQGIGVEVGTHKGVFSELILVGSNLSKMCSIDSWNDLSGTKYSDAYFNHTYQEQCQFKREAVARLAKFGSRSEILHMFSAKAVKLFVDALLDFVYIDAHHTYESCSEDLTLWFPKVKIGGVFAGHDYVEDGLWDYKRVFGVKRAVDEFVKREKQTLHITKEERFNGAEMAPYWPSWYIIKEQQ